MQRAQEAAEKSLGLVHKYNFCPQKDAMLVYLIHGRAGNFDVMSPFKRCIPAGVNTIALQAPVEDQLGGFSWWRVDSQDKLSAQETAYLKIVKFIEGANLFYSLNPSRILALGFSQGAGLLSLIIQLKPQLLHGAALLAGFVIKRNISMQARERWPTKLFVAHGTRDAIIPLQDALDGVSYLKHLGFNLSFVEDEVGHKVGVKGMQALKQFILEFQADSIDLKGSS